MPNDAEKTMLDPSGGPSSARMKLGAYEATEILGRGGMAVVYKGMQQSLGRVVAIKVLPKEFSRDRQFVGRFHREAESVAKLNHPNIIQIIDKGEDNGTCYFVMEYVKGQSLSQKLANKGCTFKELVQIALQVCAALHYAHETGVVHRDIKPGNILLDDTTGVAKVADFGIAQLAEKSTAIGTLTGDHMAMGTLDYMAPEQKRDAKHVDRRADIFSIGVMLYEMATGRVPMGIFDPPSKINRELPRDFDVIVMKCLRDKPDERFQTCMELANALAGLPQTSSTMVRMITSVKSGVTTIGTEIGRKNPRYIGAILFLLAGIGAGIFGIVKYAEGREKNKEGGPGPSASNTEPVKPVEPGPDKPVPDRGEADKAFAKKIDDARRAVEEKRFAEAENLLEGIAAEATGDRAAAYASARELLRTEREEALNEDFQQRLVEVRAAAVNATDFGLERLESLLRKAGEEGVAAGVQDKIRKAIAEAKHLKDEAAAATADVDRAKRFAEAAALAEEQLKTDKLEAADATLDAAQADAKSPEEHATLTRLTRDLTSRRAAKADEEQRQGALAKALADAGTAIDGKMFPRAAKKIEEAEGWAKLDDEKALVAGVKKRLEKRQKEVAFLDKMGEAADREKTDLSLAASLYLKAAEMAPTPEDEKTARDRAVAIQARLDAERDAKADKDYADAMEDAAKARVAGEWQKMKDAALRALAAKRGNAEAEALLKVAIAKLNPEKPPPETTGKEFTFRHAGNLPGKFTSMTSVGVDKAGNVYALDARAKTLYKWDASGTATGSTLVAVGRPDRLMVDNQDRIWITDAATMQICQVDGKIGTLVRTVGSSGKNDGQFYLPLDLEALPGGDIVVADMKNYRLQRMGPDNTFRLKFGRITDKRTPFDGEVWYVAGVTADEAGNIYVSDRNLRTIQKYDGEGKFVAMVASGLRGEPADLAWAKGRIYCLDADGTRVMAIGTDGKQLATFGKNGRGPEDFGIISGIAASREGRVYVADSYFLRVTVLDPVE
ncbi:MAG: protein kinase [Planctomycetes bacterium]|nr:protein kinase [Planctomycetota bacterium]